MTGRIFDLQRSSFVDGPGIRTTVFFKGCNLRCAWCHNPESQRFEKEMLFYRDKCVGCGRCREVCPHGLEKCEFCGKCELYCPQEARRVCGRDVTSEEMMNEVRRDKSFYEASGGGVTFSGGECLLQPDFLCELLAACRSEGIRTAVDTAGEVPYSLFERVIPLTDLFLFDVKCMDSAVHKEYTGVPNERILDNLARLLSQKIPVWVRVPVVPGVNDTIENMRALRAFYEKYGFPEKTELLPYHAMGEGKVSALGREARRFAVPEKEHMSELKKIFE